MKTQSQTRTIPKKDRIAVIGDILLEINLDGEDPILKLGGAGNVAEHLGWWASPHFFVPHEYKREVENHTTTYDWWKLFGWAVNRAVIFTNTIVRPLPLRIWKDNEVIYKMNGLYPLANKFKETRGQIVPHLVRGNVDTIYLEWHFDKSYCRAFLRELKEAYTYNPGWVENLTIYLDSRLPSKVDPSLFDLPLKCVYWKMNDIEFQDWKQSAFPGKMIKNCIILNTHGRDGCTVLHCDDTWYTMSVEPTDHPHVQPCGCGDSFFTAFLAANEILEGLTLEEAVKIGSVAGGIAVSEPNVVIVTPAQIKEYLLNTEVKSYKEDRLLVSLNNY
jgi:hypothetical protein